jgi:hypothetical protein
MNSLARSLKAAFLRITGDNAAKRLSIIAIHQELARLLYELKRSRPNDLANHGYKVFSQNDEDGIIAAIFDRVGGGHTFLEIGVENGRECNTHLLILKGWKGCWIDGSAAMCKQVETDLGARVFPGRFRMVEAMVNADNICDLYRDAAGFCGVNDLDFFSLDIDGNDQFVLSALLKGGARPTVICAEYNGKFPPPLSISVKYDAGRGWDGDDHFGASLQGIADIVSGVGYHLITCNITGANAFFVRDDHASSFPVATPAEVWRPLRLELCPIPPGHKPTLGFVRDALKN